ncbi:hypothetical protein GCM10009549_52900 [Streptomyces thermoalcalitolerans]|uniref:Uncharacterized protein n=1 Tax=Streptomyces thermoalcalitolerans TaxID=65605 RepID=A0ABP4A0U6_9ACTN
MLPADMMGGVSTARAAYLGAGAGTPTTFVQPGDSVRCDPKSSVGALGNGFALEEERRRRFREIQAETRALRPEGGRTGGGRSGNL